MTEYSMLASGENFHRICFPEDWMQVAVDDDVATNTALGELINQIGVGTMEQ